MITSSPVESMNVHPAKSIVVTRRPSVSTALTISSRSLGAEAASSSPSIAMKVPPLLV